MTPKIFLLLLIIILPVPLYAQFTSRLPPPIEDPWIYYADAVSYNSDGDWFVVSRQNELVGSDEQVGAVYLYNYNNGWQFRTRLQAPAARVHMSFGFATAMMGNVLLVGSADGMHIFRKDGQGNWQSESLISQVLSARSGSFRPFAFIDEDTVVFLSTIYHYQNGTWVQNTVLPMSGRNISASEDHIWLQTAGGGDAKFQTFTRSGQQWMQGQQFEAVSSDDVAMYGIWAAHPEQAAADRGVKMYKFDGQDWVYHSKISHPEATTFFAEKIDMSNNRILIGDYDHDARVVLSSRISQGRAYLYEYNPSNDTWGLLETYTGGTDESFGRSVSLTDEAVLVGSKEASYVFEPPATPTGNEEAKDNLEPEITVYPNPINTQGTLELKHAETEQIAVYVFDLLGRNLQTPFTGMIHAGELKRITIKRDDLPAGAYIVRVQAGSKQYSYPVLMQ